MVLVIKYDKKEIDSSGTKYNEEWVKFLDSDGNQIGKPMKMIDWVSLRYNGRTSEKVKKFLKDNDEFLW